MDKRVISVGALLVLLLLAGCWGVKVAELDEGGTELESQPFNGSFDQWPEGFTEQDALGKVPFGWVVSTGPNDPSDTTHWSVSLSDEMAYDGNHSLRVQTTASDLGSIMISSKPIPVEVGKTYAMLARVFNTSEPPSGENGPMFYLEFWDENHWWQDTDFWSEERWQDQLRATRQQNLRLPNEKLTQANQHLDTWQEVFLSGEAPVGAKYVTIGIWLPNNRLLKSYIDKIQFAVAE